MPKIVVESGMVLNLGGYILERKTKLDCVDVVLGNPLKEDVKLDAPAYSQETIDGYAEQGMIIDYVREGDSLKQKLEEMSERIKKVQI